MKAFSKSYPILPPHPTGSPWWGEERRGEGRERERYENYQNDEKDVVLDFSQRNVMQYK